MINNGIGMSGMAAVVFFVFMGVVCAAQMGKNTSASLHNNDDRDVFRVEKTDGEVVDVRGDLEFPTQWTVFAPLDRNAPAPPSDVLKTMPEKIRIGQETLSAHTVRAVNSQYDLRQFLGTPRQRRARVAYAFVPLQVPSRRTVTLGMGADWLLQAWLNGEEIFNTAQDEDGEPAQGANPPFPPSIRDYTVDVELNEGLNVLAVRLVSGRASSTLALGGPEELRAGNFNSILTDPFLMIQALPEEAHSGAGRWTQPHLRADTADKPVADIGSRLELFVDEFLVDSITGGAMRRLHHPTPREVVMEFGDEGKPWDVRGGNFPSVVQDEERVLLFYRGTDSDGRREVTCVLESSDGINFTRPNLGIHELEGGTDNNIIWAEGTSTHNFSAFIDKNPNAPQEERFKAIARPPRSDIDGALIGFVSPDGLHWKIVDPEGGFATSPTDSQNQSFWDPNSEKYVCYMRGFPEHRGGVRDIRISESEDFIHWSDPQYINYSDDRWEHLYTNGIQPYYRAPHIYIGLPNRFVPARKKIQEHPHGGVNETVLMSSRDGRLFSRWEEAFLRPNTDRRNWTDRNHYVAVGMVQTSPTEISLYWKEHNRHATERLRRGTIRIDGFVSLHAGGEVGELLTRPLIFAGDRLVVNYATSAIGTLRFELCDIDGNPIEGFGLTDSKLLYGNEIEHTVEWSGGSNISELEGRPVRLRVRLHDADLYSIRFIGMDDQMFAE